jgi:phosphoribosylanthranilate isomerase
MSDKRDCFSVEVNGMSRSLPRHCPHRGGRLDLGYLNVRTGTLTCPLHGARFDVCTGARLSGPDCGPLATCPGQTAGTDLWGPGQGVRVKLCEFESLDAAYGAARLGAHGLGFHLFCTQNVRARLQRFRAIFRHLPARTDRVLLTDLEMHDLEFVLDRLAVHTVQLYPDWTPAQIARLRAGRRLKVLKVMSAVPEENFADDDAFLARYGSCTDGILLDSRRRGGTGVPADWDHCADLVRRSPVPVFLAGGLTSANVSEAIRKVQPFGVDVENGVSERIPGGPLVKDMAKVAAFLEAARAVSVPSH